MNRIMTNYEKVSRVLMPAIRSHTANILVKEHHMPQLQVAQILGTTQAAISKYISSPKTLKDQKIMQVVNSTEFDFYIHSVISKDYSNLQRSTCKLCQSFNKFNCHIMIK